MSFESTDDRHSQKNIQGQSEKTNPIQNKVSTTSRRSFLGQVTLFTATATGVVTSLIVGAQATLLKAFFNENFVIPNPVEPDPNDPTKVIPYRGEPLTVGGELNKLASNYAIGRSFGGIHWRSDLSASLALGEEIAISILRDERLGYNERFEGFTFTKFDGTRITV